MARKRLEFKGLRLNDFQIEAVESIEKGNSVLVSAPTGAGKTLVAEYAIQRALSAGGRAIYTAPIKALSNQKYRDFRDDPDVDVGLMTGDVTLNPGAPLLIMTTEIFRNTIFEAPERFEDVAYLIFDEIHYLDDPERGTVWEESLIFAPEDIRLICLSATIQNLESFGRWIRKVRKQDLDIILHEERPVPLVHRFYHGLTGGFRYEKLKGTQAKVRGALHKTRNRRRDGSTSPHLASRRLIDELCDGGALPVLYFCFSRRECEIKAERNAYRKLLKPNERRKIARLFDQTCALFQLDQENDTELSFLRERALRGIGFHHAGMLPIHKEIVERLFTSGLLKLLFTTETFALGINMPARTAVFDSLRKFNGIEFGYMMRRDYLQMAGRAGRQGIDDEGLVFSVLDNEDVLHGPLKHLLYGKPEPIRSRFNLSYSTLMNLYSRVGRGLVSAYEKSFSYFELLKGSQKRRATIRSQETARILRKLNVLEDAGYIDDDEGLLPRAQIARQVNGYEIQLTELLFQGLLDSLEPPELAAIFAGIVYEERRGDQQLVHPGQRALDLGRAVTDGIRRFTSIETRHGFDATLKLPDFGLWSATVAWCQGCDFEDLEHHTNSSSGDIVRTFRMAIQMLRQLQHALAKSYPLHHALEKARIMLNRDAVDAKKQLELG